MPVYTFDEMPGEFVTAKHSTAFGPLITGERIAVGLLRYKAGEDAEIVSTEGIVGGVGHKIWRHRAH